LCHQPTITAISWPLAWISQLLFILAILNRVASFFTAWLFLSRFDLHGWITYLVSSARHPIIFHWNIISQGEDTELNKNCKFSKNWNCKFSKSPIFSQYSISLFSYQAQCSWVHISDKVLCTEHLFILILALDYCNHCAIIFLAKFSCIAAT